MENVEDVKNQDNLDEQQDLDEQDTEEVENKLAKAKKPTTLKQVQLYKMAHDYLLQNFHKFSEYNKIKVALVIVSKYIPTKIEGGIAVNQMPVIVKDGKPLEVNFPNAIDTTSS